MRLGLGVLTLSVKGAILPGARFAFGVGRADHIVVGVIFGQSTRPFRLFLRICTSDMAFAFIIHNLLPLLWDRGSG